MRNPVEALRLPPVRAALAELGIGGEVAAYTVGRTDEHLAKLLWLNDPESVLVDLNAALWLVAARREGSANLAADADYDARRTADTVEAWVRLLGVEDAQRIIWDRLDLIEAEGEFLRPRGRRLLA